MNKQKNPVILIDFDGTVVYHNWPEIETIPGCVEVLKELVANNVSLILYTMRSDRPERNYLTEAIDWFKTNNIPLYGIQTHPTQLTWTQSPKAHGDMCIDDRNLGQPVINHPLKGRYVDWYKTRELLVDQGYIEKTYISEPYTFSLIIDESDYANFKQFLENHKTYWRVNAEVKMEDYHTFLIERINSQYPDSVLTSISNFTISWYDYKNEMNSPAREI